MVGGRRWRWLLLASGLAAASFTVPSTASGTGDAQIYRMRTDPRLCPSPACGGYFAARVNMAATPCHDGTTRPACYVAAVDLDALAPVAAARARAALAGGRPLVSGSFASFSGPTGLKLATLAAQQAWIPAGETGDGGETIYRVVDTGIRCVRAPCFSLRATVVNTNRTTRLSGVDLAAPGVSSAALRRAHALLAQGGVLAGGTARTVKEPGWPDTGRVLDARELWLPA